MPCNIGYKSYAKAIIPASQPQTYKEKVEGPRIDAELLSKLGVEDPEFLEWVQELDAYSLAKEALKRALKTVPDGGTKFTIVSDGSLNAEGSYRNERERKLLSKTTSLIAERWQFELIGIVAELMDYDPVIVQKGGKIILTAKESNGTHPCKHFEVSKDNVNATVVFEHFKSKEALRLEQARFVTLLHRLGVQIQLVDETVHEGDPFSSEERQRDSDRLSLGRG